MNEAILTKVYIVLAYIGRYIYEILATICISHSENCNVTAWATVFDK